MINPPPTAPATSPGPDALKSESWNLQANQSDHGETSVICDGSGTIICSIPSPVWDKSAALEAPQDAANARLLLAAPAMFKALVEAEKALDIIAESDEQETETTEAGGWATDALRVVRKALRAAVPQQAKSQRS